MGEMNRQPSPELREAWAREQQRAAEDSKLKTHAPWAAEFGNVRQQSLPGSLIPHDMIARPHCP